MADDFENIEQIYLQANEYCLDDSFINVQFLLHCIIDEVMKMLEEGYIKAEISNNEIMAPLDKLNYAAIHHYWFGMTEKGRREWDAHPYQAKKDDT